MSAKQRSIVWHLMKVAGLWFVLAQAATIAANTYRVPSKPFTWVAVAIFLLHSLLVIFDTSSGDGSSGKLYSGAVTTLLVGGLIVLSLRVTQSDDLDGVRKRVSWTLRDLSDWIAGTDQTLKNMQAREHLAAALRLIFEEGTRLSLIQAQLHLRRIPPNTPEHASALNLMTVAEARLAELDWTEGIVPKRKSPIVIVSRDQKNGRLRVTLKNKSAHSVRNIRYRVSYFRIASGLQISPDTEARIAKMLRPQESLTLEIPDAILNTPVHASFVIVDWDIAG
jgi:hypothetical protein